VTGGKTEGHPGQDQQANLKQFNRPGFDQCSDTSNLMMRHRIRGLPSFMTTESEGHVNKAPEDIPLSSSPLAVLKLCFHSTRDTKPLRYEG
jgi:hypothetical protein